MSLRIGGGVDGLVQVCASRGSDDGRPGRARLPPHLVRQDGFAMSTAEPGTGKRVATRLLAHRFERHRGAARRSAHPPLFETRQLLPRDG